MSVESRVKISSLVDNQLPSFVRDDHPLVGEFLSQYYLSLEGQGSTLDIVKNIDQYVKVDNLKKETWMNRVNLFYISLGLYLLSFIFL